MNQSNVALFERFGKYAKTVKSGLHYVNPCTDSLRRIDLKVRVIDLSK